ncbi:MAG: alkaline phosphatase, partial [Calditrichales bacterium]
AASATAMSSGEKTNNGTIGQDTLQQPLETMVEHMEKRGKSTGVVTSVPFPHATPAAFLAHNDSRGHYSEIAREMILQTGVDVIMGAGHPEYDVDGKTTTDTSYRYVGGYDLWQKLKAGQVATDADGDGIPDTWTLIQERSEFQELANGETPKRLIGVPLVGSTLQLERFMASETGTPYSVPFIESVPTLTEMSLAALNVLDNNKNGFFLMIEGGGVDWASHANHLGRMIEEEIEFNKTIEAVYAWVEENSSWDETLIIITGDHETGYLTGPGSNPDSTGSDPVLEDIWKPLVNNGKGEVPGAQWHTGGHVNSLIPFYSKGAGSARFVEAATRVDLVRGNFLDNTDIGKIIKSFQ